MTTETANFFFDLDNTSIKEMLVEYQKLQDPKHVPSIKAIKAVASYLGHRQRNRPKHGGIAVDETLTQIKQATCYSVSTISDVLKFLEYFRYLETLKRGGGPRKQPTVRRLITQKTDESHFGKIQELNEIYAELNGKSHDLNGACPDTPRELPRFIPRVCTRNNPSIIYEEPFNEEDFISEEHGFTPEDVVALLCDQGFSKPEDPI